MGEGSEELSLLVEGENQCQESLTPTFGRQSLIRRLEAFKLKMKDVMKKRRCRTWHPLKARLESLVVRLKSTQSSRNIAETGLKGLLFLEQHGRF
jgi:hypothetical protein